MYIVGNYMYCKNCGKEIEDDSSFCPYCGSSVDKKIVVESKATKGDKGNSENCFGAIGFVVSVIAVLYSHSNIALWYVAFALAFIGIVLSCAGMKDLKKGKNGIAFAGFIIGAIALFDCGDRWLGFSIMISKCNGYI